SPRNRRACKRYSGTTRRWQNSIAPPARRAPTKRRLLTWRRVPRKRKPITPAVAWTQKESQRRVTIARREYRLKNLELHIPNRPQSEIPNRLVGAFGI